MHVSILVHVDPAFPSSEELDVLLRNPIGVTLTAAPFQKEGPEKPVGSMPTWRRRYLTLSMTTLLVNGPGIEVELAGYIVKSCGRRAYRTDYGFGNCSKRNTYAYHDGRGRFSNWLRRTSVTDPSLNMM
jgi:hypothetical protein